MSRSLLRSVLLASCCTTAVACIDTGALKMPSGTGGAAGKGGTGGGAGSALGIDLCSVTSRTTPPSHKTTGSRTTSTTRTTRTRASPTERS